MNKTTNSLLFISERRKHTPIIEIGGENAKKD
jgi:hypothetical protein